MKGKNVLPRSCRIYPACTTQVCGGLVLNMLDQQIENIQGMMGCRRWFALAMEACSSSGFNHILRTGRLS